MKTGSKAQPQRTTPVVAFLANEDTTDGKSKIAEPPSSLGVETAPAAAVVKDKVDWAKQWYAAIPVDYLDASRPHGFQVLGKHLVLWADKDGKWNCMEDKCPHR